MRSTHFTTTAKRILDTLLPFWQQTLGRPMEAKTMPEEIRKTSETGGQKGQKLERHELIDGQFLAELAEVCGRGAAKYDDDNWRKGYSWRLSFGAMMRHAWKFWRGEEYDDELGTHHLAHVAWHCMVMFTYSKNRKRYGQFDDRPNQDLASVQSAWHEQELRMDLGARDLAPSDLDPPPNYPTKRNG